MKSEHFKFYCSASVDPEFYNNLGDINLQNDYPTHLWVEIDGVKTTLSESAYDPTHDDFLYKDFFFVEDKQIKI